VVVDVEDRQTSEPLEARPVERRALHRNHQIEAVGKVFRQCVGNHDGVGAG